MLSRALALTAAMSITALGSLPVDASPHAQADFSIVHGNVVTHEAYPEVVKLLIPAVGGSYSVCGGTILNDDWILTAAHCFDQPPAGAVTVRAWTEYGKHQNGETWPVDYPASSYFPHPDYQSTPGQRSHDIALLKLDTPISAGTPNGAFVKPSGFVPTLATTKLADAGEPLQRNGEGTVVGRGAVRWDHSRVTPQMPSGYVLDEDDQDRLREATISVHPEQTCASDVMICAEDLVPLTPGVPLDQRHDDVILRNPASCVGDSGGPLFVTGVDGQRKQVGIVSHTRATQLIGEYWQGDLCGRSHTWYASLSYLRPWIDAVVAASPNSGDAIPNPDLKVPPYGRYTVGGNGQNHATVTPPASSLPQPQPQPQPQQPQSPVEPKPKPTPKPTNLPGSNTSEPEWLRELPKPTRSGMVWKLSPSEVGDGSDISVGVNRLREAFKTMESTEGKASLMPTPAAKGALALLASEITMADALASGVLQKDAPLYLTDPAELEPTVLQELQRQKINEVWLLGGEKALQPKIVQTLEAAGIKTRRIAGADRTQTAVAIAKAKAELHPELPKTRFVARAFGDGEDETRSWADALALGGLAAHSQTPILLTATSTLSQGLDEQLAKGTPTTLIGGPAAISEQVQEQIKALTTTLPDRVAGVNRADTAGQIAKQFATAKRAIVIDGQGKNAWQLGFSLAGLSADLSAPILLTLGTKVPQETQQVLKDLSLDNVICMGEVEVCEAVTEVSNLP